MSDQDVHNFSTSSSSHRLPTVSASEALLSLGSAKSRAISTSLSKLDNVLQYPSSSATTVTTSKGIHRGHVTEIFGPPASGKSCFAMQLASNALQAGDEVLWVDTASPFPGPRLKEILSGSRVSTSQNFPSSPPVARSVEELLNGFVHIQTPTLPHLLSLFIHPPRGFPSEKTSLVVIDSVSALFAASYPKSSELKIHGQNGEKKPDNAQWAANRRWSVAGELLAKLGNLAATRNLAVVIINQTTTYLKGMTVAMLVSAISGSTWDAGIYNRIVLYRDLVSNAHVPPPIATGPTRFAAVLKATGKVIDEASPSEMVIPFFIGPNGLQESHSRLEESRLSQVPATENRQKRKREIADSEDEDESLSSDEDFAWDDAGVLAALEEEELAGD